MESIEIGKDIHFSWKIMTPQGAVLFPYELEGKNLSLYLECSCGRIELKDFRIEGSIVRWTFLGKDQKHLGVYSLELVINEEKEGMITVVKHGAFCLVDCICQEGESEDVHLRIESIVVEETNITKRI